MGVCVCVGGGGKGGILEVALSGGGGEGGKGLTWGRLESKRKLYDKLLLQSVSGITK